MNVSYIQPNPKSEVQISIENVISAAFKEASFVAIQLPRLPPFSCGSTWGGVYVFNTGTVTWHNTYAPPGRGPGLAKLLPTSKTPCVAPAPLGPGRPPRDPLRPRQYAAMGHPAPVFGSLLICSRVPSPSVVSVLRLFLARVPSLSQ